MHACTMGRIVPQSRLITSHKRILSSHVHDDEVCTAWHGCAMQPRARKQVAGGCIAQAPTRFTAIHVWAPGTAFAKGNIRPALPLPVQAVHMLLPELSQYQLIPLLRLLRLRLLPSPTQHPRKARYL